MKGKYLQPRLLYPARISFRFDGEIKSFTDKQKLREFSTTKPALQQMLKELLAVGNTGEEKDQIDLIDIYRTFHPKTAGYTFFSSAHGKFSRIDNILGHKSSLSKFKKIEIISRIFSDHNAMRLEMNYREKT